MGFFDSIFGNQDKTVQTTSNTTYDPWVSQAQQGLNSVGQNMYSDFFNVNPNYRVAGFNADQTAGFDLTRQAAQGAFQNTPSMPSWYGQSAPSVDPAASYYFAAHYDPTMATAAQLSPTAYQQFMNPFTQSVIDPTMAQMRQGHDATSAQIGAQSAAAGSYGGSREALRQGQNDRALGEQTALTTAQLNSQAYQQAQALAQANAQMQQQANLANASAANSAGQWNAQSTNQSNAANQAAKNSRDQWAASYGLTARNQDLSASQLQNTFANDAYQRQMAAVASMLGIGATEQGQLQKTISAPNDALKDYAALVPQVYNSNQVGTQPNTNPSAGQQILGAVLGIGGKFIKPTWEPFK